MSVNEFTLLTAFMVGLSFVGINIAYFYILENQRKKISREKDQLQKDKEGFLAQTKYEAKEILDQSTLEAKELLDQTSEIQKNISSEVTDQLHETTSKNIEAFTDELKALLERNKEINESFSKELSSMMTQTAHTIEQQSQQILQNAMTNIEAKILTTVTMSTNQLDDMLNQTKAELDSFRSKQQDIIRKQFESQAKDIVTVTFANTLTDEEHAKLVERAIASASESGFFD